MEGIRAVLEKGKICLIFNAGRLDYTKGFYEELLAFDRLLEKHPELIGKVVLYQLVIPSREALTSYSAYKDAIVQLARDINTKYKEQVLLSLDVDAPTKVQGYPGMPVRQIHGQQGRFRYLAHLGVVDIQSFPSLSDGMGLVPKEGAAVGKDNMTQIVGEGAGVAEEFAHDALVINPRDTEAFADALYQAYVMGEYERRTRRTNLRTIVENNDVRNWWLKDQEPAFQDIWNEKITKQV